MAGESPIDPLEGPKLAIRGRVVTMDERNRVLDDGVIFVDGGRIVDVTQARSERPPGFEDVRVVDTEGVIFPGLIELHNHLPYNVLPLWRVPKKYAHRGQWGGTEEYRRRITTPMTVLGRTRYVPSVIRYVECKNLLAGVTTTQGVELFSNAGVRRYYRGIVRNVEQTNDESLPEAATRIADVDARDARRFLERLQAEKRLILHLSEGVGVAARRHFLALHIDRRRWAINENLVGIHCTGLRARDFAVLARHHASMVWSPFSNLLLYGETADVRAAKHEGVPIALGPDWSPTGSKNLLGELKVARVFSRENDELFSDRELVAMVTRDAARILRWDAELGSIESGKRADLTVVDDDNTDPYASLLRADESEVRLVMIGGVARVGVPSIVRALGSSGEDVVVGGRPRLLNLSQRSADPAVGKLTLRAARRTLTEVLEELPSNARKLTAPDQQDDDSDDGDKDGWHLALDELVDTGVAMRPMTATPQSPLPRRLAPVTAPQLEAIDLDALAVVDDRDYLDLIAEEERNLPTTLSSRLRRLYQ